MHTSLSNIQTQSGNSLTKQSRSRRKLAALVTGITLLIVALLGCGMSHSMGSGRRLAEISLEQAVRSLISSKWHDFSRSLDVWVKHLRRYSLAGVDDYETILRRNEQGIRHRANNGNILSSDLADALIKANWSVNSYLQVYSDSSNKYLDGVVSEVNGDTLKVFYTHQKRGKCFKNVGRFDRRVRPYDAKSGKSELNFTKKDIKNAPTRIEADEATTTQLKEDVAKAPESDAKEDDADKDIAAKTSDKKPQPKKATVTHQKPQPKEATVTHQKPQPKEATVKGTMSSTKSTEVCDLEAKIEKLTAKCQAKDKKYKAFHAEAIEANGALIKQNKHLKKQNKHLKKRKANMIKFIQEQGETIQRYKEEQRTMARIREGRGFCRDSASEESELREYDEDKRAVEKICFGDSNDGGIWDSE